MVAARVMTGINLALPFIFALLPCDPKCGRSSLVDVLLGDT